jgi:Skp family chaperone for outer membrane proteins
MNWPALILLIALAGLVAYQSRASRSAAPARPTAVMIVNLERVFQGLQERSDADARLTEMAEELQAEGDRRLEELTRLQEELDYLDPNSEQFQQLAKEIVHKKYGRDAFLEFGMRKLDVEKATILRELYQKIKDAAAAMSRDNGYDIVLVDDTVAKLPEDTTEAETMRQISARRMLYANPQVDISDELIVRMNQDFTSP